MTYDVFITSAFIGFFIAHVIVVARLNKRIKYLEEKYRRNIKGFLNEMYGKHYG